MSDIKVAGKVYRDVEKMDFTKLTELRDAITKRLTELNAQGLALTNGAPTAQARTKFAMLDMEVQGLHERLKRVEQLAKQVIAKAIPKPKKENQNEPGQQTTGTADDVPASAG